MIGQEDIEQKIKYLIDLHKAHPDSDSVLMYLDTALIYADSLKSRSLEAEINRHYGNYYYHNDKAKAVTYYKKAKETYVLLNDTLSTSICLSKLGNTYYRLLNLDTAKLYYEKTISYKKILQDTNGIAIGYNGMGLVAKQKGNYEEAIDNFLKAVKFLQKERSKGIVLMLSLIHI